MPTTNTTNYRRRCSKHSCKEEKEEEEKEGEEWLKWLQQNRETTITAAIIMRSHELTVHNRNQPKNIQTLPSTQTHTYTECDTHTQILGHKTPLTLVRLVWPKSDGEWRADRLVDSTVNKGSDNKQSCPDTYFLFTGKCFSHLPPTSPSQRNDIAADLGRYNQDRIQQLKESFVALWKGKIPFSHSHSYSKWTKEAYTPTKEHILKPERSRPFHSFRWILCNFTLCSQLSSLPSWPLRAISLFFFLFSSPL